MRIGNVEAVCLGGPPNLHQAVWYRSDTIHDVAMTLRLTDAEQEALRARADAEGISMQEAARRAVREFVTRHDHRDRVGRAAHLIIESHSDALRRLGE